VARALKAHVNLKGHTEMKTIQERLEAIADLSIEEIDQLAGDIREAYKTMRDSGEVDLELGAQYVAGLSVVATRREELEAELVAAQEELAALDAAVFGADTKEEEAKDDVATDEVSADDAVVGEADVETKTEAEAETEEVTAEDKELVETQASTRRILKMPAVEAGKQASIPESEETVSNGQILDAEDNVVAFEKLPALLDRAAKSARSMTQAQLAATIGTEGATPKSTIMKLSVSDALPHVGRFADFETSDEAFKALLKEKRDQRSADSRAVASGGACAPRRQEYAINVIGGDAQSVGDSLVSVTSDGKGVSFFRDLEFSDMTANWTGGINSYTEAQDISAAAYPKGIATVNCPTTSNCDKEIREKGINFGNWMTWAFPELVSAIQEGGNAQFARHLEEKRLTAIYDYANTLSNVLVDTSQNLDASINFVDKILRLVTADRRDNRLGDGQRYIAYIPRWARAQLQVGMIAMLDGLGDGLSVEAGAFEVLRRWNVDIVFYDDAFKSGTGTAGNLPTNIQAAVGTTVPLWQTTVRVGLVRDDAVYLDRGPTLDLGLVRTQDDIEQNNYTLFYETLEGICFKNKGVFVLDLLLCPNGAQAGTVTPTCAGVTSVVAS
jgi:hypothetical protein